MVKIAASILACLILFLSTETGVRSLYTTAVYDDCCFENVTGSSLEKNAPSRSNNNEGCKGCCNPFLACSGCAGFPIPSMIVNPVSIVVISSVRKKFELKKVQHPFIVDFLHPPQIT